MATNVLCWNWKVAFLTFVNGKLKCWHQSRSSDRCHQKLCCWGPVIDDIPVNTGSHIINDYVWLSYFEINNDGSNFIILKVLFQDFQNLCMNIKRSKRALAPCKIFDVELDVPRSVATRTIRLTYIENVCSTTQCTFNTATSNVVCSVHNTVLSCCDSRTAHLYSRYTANNDQWC